MKFFANGFTKKGVPDILACVNGRFVGIEVKSEDGKASPLQIRNMEKIQDCGGVGIILYPQYFDSFKAMMESLLESKRRGHAIASGIPRFHYL